jgi:HAMP domain-containing protein
MSQRNALEAASNADNSGRLLAVTELALKIGELTSVTDESFASLADRLGLPVEQFLGDLGVSLDDLTAETVVALGDVANLLGIELPELASSVNVALGNLEDQNSLINDALEMTIQALPSGIQDSLAPLLTAIERETDPAAREALLQQFVDIADALPADQRDLLAPFFEQIDPLSEAQQQIDQMVTLNTTNEAIRNELAESNFRQEGLVSNLNDEVREQSSAINRLAGNVRDLLFAIESGGITP